MPYRLRKKESMTVAVRRIVREETDQAIDDLKGVLTGQPRGVHEARKRIKKLRSLLRLVRPRLGDRAAQANAILREAARPLSTTRDAQAMVDAFDALVQWSQKPAPSVTVDAIRSRLVGRRDAAHGNDPQLAATVAASVEKLREVRAMSHDWSIRPGGFAGLSRGLTNSYRKAIDTMRRAYAGRADEHFHDWRKQVKNHWYHVRLLRGLWTRMMTTRGTELGTLSDLLGDDHDLAVMRELLAQERLDAGIDLDAFLPFIDDRRRALRRTARTLGKRLFAESPKRLRKRFEAYWDAWHTEDTKPEEVLGNIAAVDDAGFDDGTRPRRSAAVPMATVQ